MLWQTQTRFTSESGSLSAILKASVLINFCDDILSRDMYLKLGYVPAFHTEGEGISPLNSIPPPARDLVNKHHSNKIRIVSFKTCC